MSPLAAARLVLLLSLPASAADPRLSSAPDPEPGSFAGLTLSLGPGRPVCARATYDRAKAAAGGRVLVVDGGESGDEDAVRLSEAVLARRGGLTSRVAISARRHGVPAVALGRGEWDGQGRLVLREPTFGSDAAGGGSVRPASGERERVLAEGDAVCVDAAAARLVLPESYEADARVDAADAARAYDGLRDAAALERWLEADPREDRASALLRELAPRALEGGISAADLARVEKAARAAAGSGAPTLGRVERRAWDRALRAARAGSADCASAAADAPSAEVLDRLTRDASELAERAAAAGKVYGGGDGGLGGLAAACKTAAAKRRRSVPAASPSLDDASTAAGAARAQAVELPATAWPRFVEENGLREYISQTLDDASLGLRRKSERIRERVLASRLTPESEAARAVLAAASSCPCLIVGEDATLKADDSAQALAMVKDAWAASWGPGPLGARLRAGRGADYAGRVRVSRVKKADVSGLLFSRDPGSGRRRILIEAAPGGIDALLAGGAAADRWALDPRSGRTLEFVAASPDGKPRLTPAQLARLARLARGLDAWRGAAVEAAFSFEGDDLVVHHARPLEPPRPPQPLNDPFTPRPSPEALSVKPVR
jgi:phosphohistidine swiveling domain-containing protein